MSTPVLVGLAALVWFATRGGDGSPTSPVPNERDAVTPNAADDAVSNVEDAAAPEEPHGPRIPAEALFRTAPPRPPIGVDPRRFRVPGIGGTPTSSGPSIDLPTLNGPEVAR